MAEEAAKAQGVEKIIVVENGSYDKVEAQFRPVKWRRWKIDEHVGSSRELRAHAGREHQERRL